MSADTTAAPRHLPMESAMARFSANIVAGAASQRTASEISR